MTVAVRGMLQLWATFSRSVPIAVWLDWWPVCAHSSLSHTTTTRFRGFSLPMLAMVPRFISREPSPSREITFSSVERAIPRAMDEQRPILP